MSFFTWCRPNIRAHRGFSLCYYQILHARRQFSLIAPALVRDWASFIYLAKLGVISPRCVIWRSPDAYIDDLMMRWGHLFLFLFWHWAPLISCYYAAIRALPADDTPQTVNFWQVDQWYDSRFAMRQYGCSYDRICPELTLSQYSYIRNRI